MNKPLNIPSLKTSENSLAGHVYLVTGASGGLGRIAALALAKQGASVILTGRRIKRLESVYDEIEQAGYPQAALIPFDLEQKDEAIYQQLINSIYNEFKRLDGIINAASDLGIVGPVGSQDSDIWTKVQQVNVQACFLLSKVCLPLLQQSSAASIIFISDSSARCSKPYWGAYGVSKAAIESYSAMLADELDASSVVCNVFIPGPSMLPTRKKTHPAEDETTLHSEQKVADSLIGVIKSRQTGQTYMI